MATLKPRLVKGISYHDKVAGFAQFLKDRWLLFIGWLVFFVLTVLVFWLTPHSPMDWGTVGYLFFDAKCLDGVLFSNQLLI